MIILFHTNMQQHTQIHFSEDLQTPMTCVQHQQVLADWSQQCLQWSASAVASNELDSLKSLAHRHACRTAQYPTATARVNYYALLKQIKVTSKE